MDMNNQKIVANDLLKARSTADPSIVLECADGKVRVYSFPISDQDSKEKMTMALRALMGKLNVLKYTFVLEAWMSTNPDIKPSMSPTRQEYMVFLINDRVDETCTFWPIQRKEDGSGFVTETHDVNQNGQSGLMCDLFDTEPYEKLSFTKKRAIDKLVLRLLNMRAEAMPTFH